MKTPKVALITLNWKQPDLTIDCMKSISKLNTKGFDLEVFVVDNGSGDDSVPKIKKAINSIKNNKTKFSVLENKSNLGFADGNNVGIKKALDTGADFVLLLNNDTIVDKNLVSEMLAVAQQYTKAALISPKIYFAKGYEFHKNRYKENELGNVIWSAGGDIDWANVYGKNHGVDAVDKGQFDKVKDVDFATGACVLIKSKAIREVGMFDSNYFMYFEDVDLSERMRRSGWRILYAPKAVLWHKVAQSSKVGGELNDYFITRNRLLFGIRYAPIRAKLAIIRESFVLTTVGRAWQIKGCIDFYLRRFGKGRWK